MLSRDLNINMDNSDSDSDSDATLVKQGKQEETLNYDEAASKIQRCFRKFQKRKEVIAREAQWLTGSSGAVMLTMLPHTHHTLVPTGELLFNGYGPLCGELRGGIKLSGKNMDHLSGVFITEAGYKTSLSYGEKLFTNDLAKLQKTICFSLEKKHEVFFQ